MHITLNGKKVEADCGVNLLEFICSKGLEPERIVIEYNFEILNREDWGKIILKESDNLEVLRFMGGG